MRTIKLIVQYDGTRYAGWQRQASRQAQKSRASKLKTVQEELEKAIEKIVRHRVKIEGSGRTDAGTHAVAQAAHFATSSNLDARALMMAANRYLPDDIAISYAREAPLKFHARFCAVSKTYQYVILPSSGRHVFLQKYAYAVKYPLSVSLMRKACAYLLGKHDFSSFQSSDRSKRKSTTEIKNIVIRKQKCSKGFPFLKGLDIITIEIEASGFLRSMVRNIVGTLIDIGRGRLSSGSMEGILAGRDRRYAGPCAPSRGLYLVEVRY